MGGTEGPAEGAQEVEILAQVRTKSAVLLEPLAWDSGKSYWNGLALSSLQQVGAVSIWEGLHGPYFLFPLASFLTHSSPGGQQGRGESAHFSGEGTEAVVQGCWDQD